ncbi:unnamed protein product [Linum tenue]|uniref:Uncharacterized protein n=1 Tax=Linum tenue TaxID=586396 RepID=A0AAV0M5M8_9ROSI|nr:unnamed protein product [Linum tenue]
MAVKSNDGGGPAAPSPAFVDTVAEIMRLYRSLPPRPSIDEVEASVAVVKSIQNEEQAKLEEISKHQRPPDVPEELFALLQQVRRTVAVHQCREVNSNEKLSLLKVAAMIENSAKSGAEHNRSWQRWRGLTGGSCWF